MRKTNQHLTTDTNTGFGALGNKSWRRSCLIVKWKKGGKSRSQRETMQMWEGGDRGEQREVSTLCTWHTHRAVQNIWDTDWGGQGIRRMGAGWDTDVRGEASTSTGDRGSTSFWSGEGMGDLKGGSRWTGSDNMQEQIWSATTTEKIWEFIPFRVMKKKEAFFGFLWKVL